ncbi:MAG: transposase, partial [Thermoanaerobaculia bacterium]
QYRERFGFRLLAFCLMDNHVHLAIEAGKTPLSRCMHALQSSYSQDFNRRHRRVGHLFQGRYKALLVEKDRYWLALLRYIHRNPVEAGIVDRPDRYPWSSDRAYRLGRGPKWLDVDRGLSHLEESRGAATRRYRRFMSKRDVESYEEAQTIGQAVRGDEAFARGVFQAAGGLELVRRSLTVAGLSRIVAGELRQDLEFLRSPTRRRETSIARAMVGHLGMIYARIPYCRTAEFFRRDGSTLARDIRGFEQKLRETKALRSSLARIVERL